MFLSFFLSLSWSAGASSSSPRANVSRSVFHDRPINVTSVNSQLANISHFTSAGRKFFLLSFLLSVDSSEIYSLMCGEVGGDEGGDLKLNLWRRMEKRRRKVHLNPSFSCKQCQWPVHSSHPGDLVCLKKSSVSPV